MSEFLVLLISGLVAGAIYSVYAGGITLLYSATGIYNFAYGAIAFVGGLFFYEISHGYLPRWLAFLVAMLVFAPGLALVLERVAFRRLARVPEVQRLLGTVGLVVGLPALGYALVDLLRNSAHLGLITPQNAYTVPGLGPVPAKSFHILGEGTVSSDQLITLGVTAVAVILLWLLMTRTRMGLETRAVVDRPDLASARAIDPSRTSRRAWLLGTMFAVLAGILAGPLFGLTPATALQFVIASSAVVVVARFRSLPVALVGGLVLGSLSSLFAGYGADVPGLKQALVAVPGLSSSVVYIVLLAALLWRGIQRGRTAGVSATIEPIPPDYSAGLPRWRRFWPWAAMSAGLLLWATDVLPSGHLQAGGFEQSLIIEGLGLSLVFLSFVVVVGMLGVASLAQATFVTAGGLAAGFFFNHHLLGGSFVVDLLAGGLVAALLALVVSLPALRLGGLALALATLALALLGTQILFQIDYLQNQREGWTLNRPGFSWLSFQGNDSFIVLCFLFVVGGVWVVSHLSRSATGRAIQASRFSATAASASGISNRRSILIAFAVTGFLAGIGGVLLAYGNGSAAPATFPAETGLLWITVAVLWGVRRPGSAVLAGMTVPFLPRILQTGFWGITPHVTDTTIPSILFGLTAVALANQPDGALADISRRAAQIRTRLRLGPPVVPPAAHAQEAGTHVGFPLGVTLPESTGPSGGLRLEEVVAGYGDTEVLHDISLEVLPGTMLAILGPNGSGKSTLCNVLTGTVPTTSGRIWIEGTEVSRLPAHARVRHGLLTAPESRGIFPALTVEENLAILLPDAADREAACSRFTHLAARRHMTAGELSGGEQQILCLAPLLVKPPRVLVADEVTLGLAPTIVRQVLTVLRALRDEGVTVLIAEEKVRHVIGLADACAFLSLGRVTRVAPISELSQELAAQSYMGSAGDNPGAEVFTTR